MFEWRGGVHLSGTSLWCDARRAPGVCVLTAADVEASGASLVMTPQAARLREALGLADTRPGVTVLTAPFGRPFSVGSARIELFPSGVLPGSASVLLEVEGRHFAYAGAVGREGAELRACDVLCLYAPVATSWAVATTLARAAADQTATPVFFALGLAEALAATRYLRDAEIVVRAPARLRAALHLLGADVLSFRGTPRPGEAVIWPLGSRRAPAVTRIPHAHPCVLPRAAASGEQLVAYVRETGAREVLVVGPGAADLVRRLRAHPVDARSLIQPPEQLGLFAEAPSLAPC